MSDMSIEKVIFTNLLKNEGYMRAVQPHIKEEYFSMPHYRIVHGLIEDYFLKYETCATAEALQIELNDLELNDGVYRDALEFIKEINSIDVEQNFDWLLETTEKYCQDKAIYNAVMESIQIIDGKSKKDKGAMPELLSEALSVSFDTSIGHDFLEDYESRYDFYHKVVERLPFDIDYLNKITRGGIPRKTLNVILAGTGVGKTLMMCHFAAANLMAGKNVLYITLEMAEERIAERIDANLMNIPLNDLETLSLIHI